MELLRRPVYKGHSVEMYAVGTRYAMAGESSSVQGYRAIHDGVVDVTHWVVVIGGESE